MKSHGSLVSGFAHRPLALRRRILAVLDTRRSLSARQIAFFAFRPQRRIAARVLPNCSDSELVSTRRALRHLVAKGSVAVDGWHRGRKLYALPAASLDALTLGELD